MKLTIEDILTVARISWSRLPTVDHPPPHIHTVGQFQIVAGYGPTYSEDGTLVIHKTDPELADDLRSVCAEGRQELRDEALLTVACGSCWYCRAAQLIDGP